MARTASLKPLRFITLILMCSTQLYNNCQYQRIAKFSILDEWVPDMTMSRTEPESCHRLTALLRPLPAGLP